MEPILLLVLLASTLTSSNPHSDAFISFINLQNPKWTAGRNFHPSTPPSTFKNLAGAFPPTILTLPTLTHPIATIPREFDAREAWPACADVISDVRDQGNCGSCWANSAVEVMSDRICIHSNATIRVSLSAEDLMDCCEECGRGCRGGLPDPAFNYWYQTGIVSGGKYGSTDGCKAYSVKPCDHHSEGPLGVCPPNRETPSCRKSCDSGPHYEADRRRGYGYVFGDKVEEIQTEILKNGPIVAVYSVFEDFFSYKCGVYHHVHGNFTGMHAVKILGWGVDDGTPYWLVANSWNEYWGDHGYFKILRGSNECGIEGHAVAGLPIFTEMDTK